MRTLAENLVMIAIPIAAAVIVGIVIRHQNAQPTPPQNESTPKPTYRLANLPEDLASNITTICLEGYVYYYARWEQHPVTYFATGYAVLAPKLNRNGTPYRCDEQPGS